MNTNTATKKCSKCGYPNAQDAIECELCQYSFKKTLDKQERSVDRATVAEKLTSSPRRKKSSFLSRLNHNSFFKNNIQSKLINYKNWEILKLKNLSGIIVIGIFATLVLWRELAPKSTTRNQNNTKNDIELVRRIEDVDSVPKGIFSYSGEGYFAALLASGLLEETLDAFPNFEARYTLPINQDHSYTVAINMLLEGKVDWVFNGRPLTPGEYAKGKLQNIDLKEIAIARDGIVFYVNPELSVDKITIEQLINIFAGKITNWQQIGGADLAIVPVILSQENVESLGFDVNPAINARVSSNHTLAVREVIDTPGAFGYASASLIKDQKLLKFLSLGTSTVSSNATLYVNPFDNSFTPNKKAFEEGTYPLVRRLFLTYSDRPNSKSAGTAISNIILSNQGQDIVDRAGLVRLRGD